MIEQVAIRHMTQMMADSPATPEYRSANESGTQSGTQTMLFS